MVPRASAVQRLTLETGRVKSGVRGFCCFLQYSPVAVIVIPIMATFRRQGR